MSLYTILLFLVQIVVFYSSLRVVLGGLVEGLLNLIVVMAIVSIYIISIGGDMVGLMLLIVYVGAVVVLILIVIMLIGESHKSATYTFNLIRLIALMICFELVFCVRVRHLNYFNLVLLYEDVFERLGEVIFLEEVYSVLLVGVILLVSLLGGVYLGIGYKNKK